MIGAERSEGPRSSGQGFALVELLVAAVAAGLVGASVLALTLNGSRTSHLRSGSIEAHALAIAAVTAVAREVEAAGAGLEGAAAVLEGGQAISVLEMGSGELTVVVSAPAIEVEISTGGGYRGTDLRGLARGDRVAGLGLERPFGAPAPAGRVVRIVRDRGRRSGRLWVRWKAAEEVLIAAGGGVRALLPIKVRQMETVRRAGALQLRRRDDGSKWQPVVDGLLDFSLDAIAETVVIRARVTPEPGGSEALAVRYVRLRLP